MWLWDWHFYHSCLHIDRKIMFWILKSFSLTLRDTLERTPKVISDQNSFSRFQSWCWFRCWNLLSKNQANWLALKILVSQDFPLPSHQSNSDQISTHQSSPHPMFYVLPMKALLPLLLLEVGDWSLKTKNGHKNLNIKKSQFF